MGLENRKPTEESFNRRVISAALAAVFLTGISASPVEAQTGNDELSAPDLNDLADRFGRALQHMPKEDRDYAERMLLVGPDGLSESGLAFSTVVIDVLTELGIQAPRKSQKELLDDNCEELPSKVLPRLPGFEKNERSSRVISKLLLGMCRAGTPSS